MKKTKKQLDEEWDQALCTFTRVYAPGDSRRVCFPTSVLFNLNLSCDARIFLGSMWCVDEFENMDLTQMLSKLNHPKDDFKSAIEELRQKGYIEIINNEVHLLKAIGE